MSNLTVVILTKNEELNIVEVIANARLVTDKILVVDSGSTDKTVELAKENAAQVVYRAWDNDFAAQRNFALQYVETDWILYLDADERFDAKLIDNIKQAKQGDRDKQYCFFREVYVFGFKCRYGILRNDEVIRMFPRKSVVWKEKVHEHPVCNLKKVRLKGKLIHYTYNDLQHWVDKMGQYTTIWAENSYSKGIRTNASEAFIHAFYGFFRAYFLKLGFLDGWGGLYSSIQHFVYTLFKYLKLYELQNISKR